MNKTPIQVQVEKNRDVEHSIILNQHHQYFSTFVLHPNSDRWEMEFTKDIKSAACYNSIIEAKRVIKNNSKQIDMSQYKFKFKKLVISKTTTYSIV